MGCHISCIVAHARLIITTILVVFFIIKLDRCWGRKINHFNDIIHIQQYTTLAVTRSFLSHAIPRCMTKDFTKGCHLCRCVKTQHFEFSAFSSAMVTETPRKNRSRLTEPYTRNASNPMSFHSIFNVEPAAAWKLQFCIAS